MEQLNRFAEAQSFIDEVTNTRSEDRHRQQRSYMDDLRYEGNRQQRREAARQAKKAAKKVRT